MRDDGVQIDNPRHGLYLLASLLAESQHLSRELGRLLARLHNPHQVLLHGMVRRQAAARQASEAKHDRQQIVEVMNGAAGQLADQLEPLGVLPFGILIICSNIRGGASSIRERGAISRRAISPRYTRFRPAPSILRLLGQSW